MYLARKKRIFKSSVLCGALISFILICSSTFAQTWGKIYWEDNTCITQNAIEYYDHGFLILGYKYLPEDKRQGVLIKTDINGNLLWKKYIGSINNFTHPVFVSSTSGGEILISGFTNIYDPEGDPFILKLNRCGEIESLFIIRTKGYNSCNSAYIVENKSIIANCYRILQKNSSTTTVLKLDNSGKILWQNTNDGWVRQFLVNTKGDFILTGNTFTPLSGSDTSILGIRALLYSVNLKGKTVFYNTYLRNYEFFTDGGNTIINNDNTMLSLAASRSSRFDHFPVIFMIKYNDVGDTQWTKVLTDTSLYEQPGSIGRINDTFSIITTWKSYSLKSHNYQLKLYKIDRQCNVIDTNLFVSGQSLSPNSIVRTSDGKFIIGGITYLDGIANMYLMKINSNLQSDTFYQDTNLYDILCNDSISNSTITFDNATLIPLELDSLLSMQNKTEISKEEIVISPNPCISSCLIELPGEQKGLNILTIYSTDGRIIRTESFNGNSFKLCRNELKNGFYFLFVKNNYRLFSGIVIFN